MALEKFVNINFKGSSLVIIRQANEILKEMAEQGYTLTLRQLYYQFVSRDLLGNTQKNYKRLGAILNDARLAGRIDWSFIEDRTRNMRAAPHWDSPGDIVRAAANQFRYDRWEDQPNRLEVWIEKDALVGVIEPVCRRLDVGFFACRGYTSQSEQYAAGKRFEAYGNAEQQIHVLHLGDHDPSGLDMTRDNDDRLNMFCRHHVQVHRLALNMDQVKLYNPPPNPAKDTDARFSDYAEKYGEESWELDALSPATISELVENAINNLMDQDLMEAALEREATAKKKLEAVAKKLAA